jgi:hypothetical protein
MNPSLTIPPPTCQPASPAPPGAKKKQNARSTKQRQIADARFIPCGSEKPPNGKLADVLIRNKLSIKLQVG